MSTPGRPQLGVEGEAGEHHVAAVGAAPQRRALAGRSRTARARRARPRGRAPSRGAAWCRRATRSACRNPSSRARSGPRRRSRRATQCLEHRVEGLRRLALRAAVDNHDDRRVGARRRGAGRGRREPLAVEARNLAGLRGDQVVGRHAGRAGGQPAGAPCAAVVDEHIAGPPWRRQRVVQPGSVQRQKRRARSNETRRPRAPAWAQPRRKSEVPRATRHRAASHSSRRGSRSRHRRTVGARDDLGVEALVGSGHGVVAPSARS